jgi:dihydrofolate reductase
MGRKTFESIGKALPNRENVIITRNKEFKAENCIIVNSIQEVLEKYNNCYVIGGDEIYRQFLPYTDLVELTYIDKEFDGDSYFPDLPNSFIEVKREDNECKEFKFSYITYYNLSLTSANLKTEGWDLQGVMMNGGSKIFSKNDYLLVYNGENKLYQKNNKGKLSIVELSKMSGEKKKILFEGDIFNVNQLHDLNKFLK